MLTEPAVVKLSITIGDAFAGVAAASTTVAKAARDETTNLGLRELVWSGMERPFVQLGDKRLG
jgi:hypothetical protein